MTKQWLDMWFEAPSSYPRPLDWGIPLPLEEKSGMENVSMSGLRLFRVTTHVPNYGHSDTQVETIGKSGGRFLAMVKNLDICIS